MPTPVLVPSTIQRGNRKLLTVHAKNDPHDSWLEVDGKKVEGIEIIVSSTNEETFALSLSGELKEDGITIVWEDWK